MQTTLSCLHSSTVHVSLLFTYFCALRYTPRSSSYLFSFGPFSFAFQLPASTRYMPFVTLYSLLSLKSLPTNSDIPLRPQLAS